MTIPLTFSPLHFLTLLLLFLFSPYYYKCTPFLLRFNKVFSKYLSFLNRIGCPNVATCLSVDCCFSELAL
jgi:hypothetical protein